MNSKNITKNCLLNGIREQLLFYLPDDKLLTFKCYLAFLFIPHSQNVVANKIRHVQILREIQAFRGVNVGGYGATANIPLIRANTFDNNELSCSLWNICFLV